MIDKKKLKEEYKSVVQPKGIFTLKNTKNGKVFLGSSLNLKNKELTLKMSLNNGNHFNFALQEDWNKYGEDAFDYEVLETLELKEDTTYDYNEDLEILEMLWVDKFRPLSEKTYNKKEKIRLV
ncbi:MAG: GIY-YIG nuclease family protein [bacterium]